MGRQEGQRIFVKTTKGPEKEECEPERRGVKEGPKKKTQKKELKRRGGRARGPNKKKENPKPNKTGRKSCRQKRAGWPLEEQQNPKDGEFWPKKSFSSEGGTLSKMHSVLSKGAKKPGWRGKTIDQKPMPWKGRQGGLH